MTKYHITCNYYKNDYENINAWQFNSWYDIPDWIDIDTENELKRKVKNTLDYLFDADISTRGNMSFETDKQIKKDMVKLFTVTCDEPNMSREPKCINYKYGEYKLDFMLIIENPITGGKTKMNRIIKRIIAGREQDTIEILRDYKRSLKDISELVEEINDIVENENIEDDRVLEYWKLPLKKVVKDLIEIKRELFNEYK